MGARIARIIGPHTDGVRPASPYQGREFAFDGLADEALAGGAPAFRPRLEGGHEALVQAHGEAGGLGPRLAIDLEEPGDIEALEAAQPVEGSIVWQRDAYLNLLVFSLDLPQPNMAAFRSKTAWEPGEP